MCFVLYIYYDSGSPVTVLAFSSRKEDLVFGGLQSGKVNMVQIKNTLSAFSNMDSYAELLLSCSNCHRGKGTQE
jgi:hypothetical protein